jgi:cold shock CspA family protein
MKPERLRGTVKFYNDDKASGYIVRADGEPDLFFHISQWIEADYEPRTGQQVEFIQDVGRRGLIARRITRAAG